MSRRRKIAKLQVGRVFANGVNVRQIMAIKITKREVTIEWRPLGLSQHDDDNTRYLCSDKTFTKWVRTEVSDFYPTEYDEVSSGRYFDPVEEDSQWSEDQYE